MKKKVFSFLANTGNRKDISKEGIYVLVISIFSIVVRRDESIFWHSRSRSRKKVQISSQSRFRCGILDLDKRISNLTCVMRMLTTNSMRIDSLKCLLLLTESVLFITLKVVIFTKTNLFVEHTETNEIFDLGKNISPLDSYRYKLSV